MFINVQLNVKHVQTILRLHVLIVCLKSLLKFIDLDDKRPMKQLLMSTLHNLPSHDKTQISMIVIHLVTVYLNELGILREGGTAMTAVYEDQQNQFRKFLAITRVKVGGACLLCVCVSS